MSYLDSYQFRNRKFKFCFYILVHNGLNDLVQVCILLKVIYVYKYLHEGDDDSIL